MQNKIDLLAEQTLREWDIPGLALSIIHKDKDLKIQGYGIQSIENKTKINPDTYFQIASLTKAFTAAAVDILVEAGSLSWEQPILKYLPDFQLKDPLATKEMTLRDLLSQRTGLPGVSREEARRFWYHTGRSTEDLIRRLAFVDPCTSFRSHFAYNDMSYVVAGKVIEKITGTSWEQFCTEKIFQPLGMKRTCASFHTLVQDSNVALGHYLTNNKKHLVSLLNWDNMRAAGGVYTCARDMASWLRFCLSKSPLIARPQVLFEVEGFCDAATTPAWSIFSHEQPIVSYGYGWMIYSLGGKIILFHPALSDGMQSITAIVPEEQLGIAIFVNQAQQLGAACFLNELLDLFLTQPAMQWHKKGHMISGQIEKTVQEKINHLRAIRLKNKPPQLNLIHYVGEYMHPAYGSIAIKLEDNHLRIKLFSQEEVRLAHWQNEQFEIQNVLFSPPLPWFVTFGISSNKVVHLSMEGFGQFMKEHEQ